MWSTDTELAMLREKRQIKDVGKCLALWKAGWSIRKIAFEFNVIESTVVRCLRENGI